MRFPPAAPGVADPELLLESVRLLFASLETDAVIACLLERARLHLDARDAAFAWQKDCARGDLPGAATPAQRLAARAAATAASAEPEVGEEPAGATPFWIAAPVRLDGEVAGALCARRGNTPFSADDVSRLESLLDYAQLALANSRRYELTLRRSERDPLTGLANHGHFWATLAVELGRADRYGRSLSLVMLDVDQFKRFNDRHGHLAGDRALGDIARLLEASCRDSDSVARYGGEEFAAILPETDRSGALSVAEKMCAALDGMLFRSEALAISAGVATFPDDGASAEDLVRIADADLYRSKASCSR